MDRRRFLAISGGTLALPLLDLTKAFAATDKDKDALRLMAGNLTVSPEKIVVGEKPTFTFVYTAGTLGIATNGFVKLLIPLIWTLPQSEDPLKDGYLLSILNNAGNLTVASGNPDNVVMVTFTRAFLPGEKVTIIYGDKSSGSGVKLTDFPYQDFAFPLLVDYDGTGVKSGKLFSNYVNIVAGNASKTRTIAPGSAKPDNPMLIKAVLGDAFFNYPDPVVSSKAVLSNQPGISILPSKPGDIFLSAKPTKTGILTITTVRDQISSTSNPITVLKKNEPWNLYFGDLHGHTLGSDGLNPPEHYFAYGREMAGLDVCILTDHAECIYPPNKYNWPYMIKAVEDAHRPGEYVTFPAFEWTSGKWGHRCVYYQNADDAANTGYFNSTMPQFDTPAKLYELVRKVKPIIIPHHTLATYKWEQHDPKLEPLVEIYSMWGSSEYTNNPLWSLNMKEGSSVQQGLDLGYQLGFVGGGDDHHGQPAQGITQSKYTQLCYVNGLTGFWAEALTREKIWEALQARRTYATTGARIFLRFSIDDNPMGSRIKNKDTLQCTWEIKGTDLLKEIEIVTNWNKTVYNVADIKSDEHKGEFKITLPEKPEPTGSFYYLRIKQVDNNWAWTSPIWVDKA